MIAPVGTEAFDETLDAKKHNKVTHFEIPDDGYVLQPGVLYLGVTEEYTETHAHVPFLEGKSSIGRLGIDIHATAGKGDVGFCNCWTLEISVSTLSFAFFRSSSSFIKLVNFSLAL